MLVYAFVVSGIIALVVDRTLGFRIDPEHEVSGIDLVVHAETAYDLHATAGARHGSRCPGWAAGRPPGPVVPARAPRALAPRPGGTSPCPSPTRGPGSETASSPHRGEDRR